jgi:hypothetical protein
MLSIFIMSCDKNALNAEDEIQLEAGKFPQTWQLASMSGMVANVPPSNGADMAWQENYILKTNGKFIKSRVRDEILVSATGVYEIVKLEDGDYLKLSYESEEDIIGNCSDKPEEYLKFETANSLIGTWWACDGPGLFYERTQ